MIFFLTNQNYLMLQAMTSEMGLMEINVNTINESRVTSTVLQLK